jgi:hypothetical protein
MSEMMLILVGRLCVIGLRWAKWRWLLDCDARRLAADGNGSITAI